VQNAFNLSERGPIAGLRDTSGPGSLVTRSTKWCTDCYQRLTKSPLVFFIMNYLAKRSQLLSRLLLYALQVPHVLLT